MATFIPNILSQQCQYFEDFRYSSKEFYRSVESRLVDQGIPDIQFSSVKLSKGNVLSGKREYLRITRNEYRFDVCAAPFGKGFFISWWFGERDSWFWEMLSRIPYIGFLFLKSRMSKTYYQLDTEAMFRESVKESINSTIKIISSENGFRLPSQLKDYTLADPTTKNRCVTV